MKFNKKIIFEKNNAYSPRYRYRNFGLDLSVNLFRELPAPFGVGARVSE